MAVVDKGSLPSLALRVLEETAPVSGDNTIPHGLPFTPKVYSLVVTHATGSAVTGVVKSVDATNVVVTLSAAAANLRVVVGP